MKNQPPKKEKWKFTLFNRFEEVMGDEWVSGTEMCCYFFFGDKKGKNLYLGELKIYKCEVYQKYVVYWKRIFFLFVLPFHTNFAPLEWASASSTSISFLFLIYNAYFFQMLSFIFILLNANQNVQKFFYFILFLLYPSPSISFRSLALSFLLFMHIYINFARISLCRCIFLLFFNFK